MSDFQMLVNKVMTDEAFVNALAANPEQALKDADAAPQRKLCGNL